MKRNYFVLSLILMFFGISASFATVRYGDQISDPKNLKAGDKFLLRAGTPNDKNAVVPVYKWMASLADSIVWANDSLTAQFLDPYTIFTLEAAEGTIKDKPTYYVKNEANGLYLTYVYEPTTENEEGEQEGSVTVDDKGNVDAQIRLDYTSDKAAAAPFAFVLASEGCQWGINGAYTGEDQPNATDIMMYTVCKEYTDGELLLALNQAYGTPWIANYVDWGGWFAIYEPIQEENYIEDLNALYADVAELSFIGGTGPGCYDPALVEAFDKALAQASAAVNKIPQVEEECKEAYLALEKAWLAIAVADAVPISSGYYKFHNAASTKELNKLMKAVSGKAQWGNWNGVPDVSFVWELIDRKNGTYYMRNLATNEYVSSKGAQSATGSPMITMSKDTTDNVVTFINKNNGYFVIRQRNDGSLHAESVTNSTVGGSENLVAWNYSDDGKNSASQWAFVILDEDSVEYYKKISEQLILDNELANLIALAQEKYNVGSKYQAYLTSPALIWSNAAHMSTDTLYTNKRGVWGSAADGGGYPALLDGDEKTYFHSAWGGTIAEYHYLQFDLSETPTDGFFFTYTRRPGTNPDNKDRPKTIVISATNDTVGGGTWKEITTLSDLDVTSVTVTSDTVELDAPYKYVRFTITETNTPGDTLNGYPFFSMAELQLYSTVLNENCQNALIPEQANALKEAITVAKAVEAGKTTQADIDKLQEAYDNYIAVLADPTELKAAYEEAVNIYNQTITTSTETANGDKIYPDPGTYRDEDKAAFKTVLDAVKAYIDENDAEGSYTNDGIDEQIESLTAAKEALLKTVRWFDAADADGDGTWYYIGNTKRYYDVTGVNYPNKERKDGILYVQPSGVNENKTIYWATQDSIFNKQKIAKEYAQWRFINLGDTAYAIQNRATQLYIGQYQTHPATLSASPVAFKISEIGYGSFTFKGTFLTGEPVANNYLHSQVDGQTLVYWNAWTVGSGSAWDIYTTDANRTETGEVVENYTPFEINFMDVQAGKLYAFCFPVGIEYLSDPSFDANTFTFPTYGISSISDTELTLSPKITMAPGEPFFYLANNDQSLLKPNPAAADTVTAKIKFTDMKTFAQQPLTVNGLTGTYAGTTVPAGMGYLKETVKGEEGAYTSRVQTIATTTKNQTIGKNTAYINAGMVETNDPGTITVKIEGDLETAIKDAIIDAQLGNVNVYSIDGVLIKKNVKASEATNGLAKGLYIIGNTKVVVK